MTFSAPLTSYYGCATVLPWWPSYPLILLPSYSVPCINTHAFCLCHCFILEHFVTFPFHRAILLLFLSSEGFYWPFSITYPIAPHTAVFHYPSPPPILLPHATALSHTISNYPALSLCCTLCPPTLPLPHVTISPLWHLSEKKPIRAWTQEFVLT